MDYLSMLKAAELGNTPTLAAAKTAKSPFGSKGSSVGERIPANNDEIRSLTRSREAELIVLLARAPSEAPMSPPSMKAMKMDESDPTPNPQTRLSHQPPLTRRKVMQELLEDQLPIDHAAVGRLTGAEIEDAAEVSATPNGPATADSPNLQPQIPVALGKENQDHLAALNPDQRRAVEYGVGETQQGEAGPLLVIAGAGSGKTNTLAHRVAHLVFTGTDPQRILLLTFSRRAAVEMERRAGQILSRVLRAHTGQRPPTLPWSGTFHAVGARLLREYADRIGLNDSFTIHDRGDSEDLLAIARHGLGLSKTEKRFPKKEACLAIYSRAVNSGAPVIEVLKSTFPRFVQWEAELKKLFDAYIGEKQSQNVLDYDDLLLYWSYMVAESGLAQEIGGRFDHILVDEYQDTNRLQASILLGMKPDGKGLTVVGDDAQSIYSFRAATVRNILDFPRQFEPQASVVTLERNYRSTQPILEASNAVIGLAVERYTKNLWTERLSSEKPNLVTVRDEADQARCVAEQVLEYREEGIALKSQAVLFRSSSHSAQLEVELGRRGIPFMKYGGLKFLEASHIKDVLSILRWVENPRSRLSGFRAVKLLPSVGPATAGKLLDAMESASDPVSAMQAFKMPPAAAGDWTSFVGMFGSLHQREVRLACRDGRGHTLVRAALPADLRGRRTRPPR